MGVFLNQKPVQPSHQVPVHEFVESKQVEVKRFFVDENGEKTTSEIVKKIVKIPISNDILENKGLKAEMFTIENLSKAGVDVMRQQPITRPFFRGSLDEMNESINLLNDSEYLLDLENEITNE